MSWIRRIAPSSSVCWCATPFATCLDRRRDLLGALRLCCDDRASSAAAPDNRSAPCCTCSTRWRRLSSIAPMLSASSSDSSRRRPLGSVTAVTRSPAWMRSVTARSASNFRPNSRDRKKPSTAPPPSATNAVAQGATARSESATRCGNTTTAAATRSERSTNLWESATRTVGVSARAERGLTKEAARRVPEPGRGAARRSEVDESAPARLAPRSPRAAVTTPISVTRSPRRRPRAAAPGPRGRTVKSSS
jgi:hypothetical protein